MSLQQAASSGSTPPTTGEQAETSSARSAMASGRQPGAADPAQHSRAGSPAKTEDPNDVNSAEFRMFRFKVEPCPHLETLHDHDWTECPYAHPGEKARRRDPRRYAYICSACPDFRKGTCKRGDGCAFAHGVFESWMHPSKYRTQLCKEAGNCSRTVCFFAHSLSELRMQGTDTAAPSTGPAQPPVGPAHQLLLPAPAAPAAEDSSTSASSGLPSAELSLSSLFTLASQGSQGFDSRDPSWSGMEGGSWSGPFASLGSGLGSAAKVALLPQGDAKGRGTQWDSVLQGSGSSDAATLTSLMERLSASQVHMSAPRALPGVLPGAMQGPAPMGAIAAAMQQLSAQMQAQQQPLQVQSLQQQAAQQQQQAQQQAQQAAQQQAQQQQAAQAALQQVAQQAQQHGQRMGASLGGGGYLSSQLQRSGSLAGGMGARGQLVSPATRLPGRSLPGSGRINPDSVPEHGVSPLGERRTAPLSPAHLSPAHLTYPSSHEYALMGGVPVPPQLQQPQPQQPQQQQPLLDMALQTGGSGSYQHSLDRQNAALAHSVHLLAQLSPAQLAMLQQQQQAQAQHAQAQHAQAQHAQAHLQAQQQHQALRAHHQLQQQQQQAAHTLAGQLSHDAHARRAAVSRRHSSHTELVSPLQARLGPHSGPLNASSPQQVRSASTGSTGTLSWGAPALPAPSPLGYAAGGGSNSGGAPGGGLFGEFVQDPRHTQSPRLG
ncbi:hypothetical protein FOA52_016088 [Chlamydomonas sp. UWO 241]|nr:hypothetical protein FOA52_016088 [Chlamydomonas sp. UWO 241]